MKLLVFDMNTGKIDTIGVFLRSRLAVVDETADAEEAVDLVRFYEYDAAVLHFAEGRPAHLDLIRRLKLSGLRAPIIVVADIVAEADRLRILEAGVDDLIAGGASRDETFLRIQNQVRRSRGFQNSTLAIGAVEINMNAKKVFVGPNEVKLTKKEYQILEILALRKGSVLSKESILDHLYGGLDEPNPKIIDVFVCKIRKKLAAFGCGDVIETNWGRGYMLNEPREASTPKPVEASHRFEDGQPLQAMARAS